MHGNAGSTILVPIDVSAPFVPDSRLLELFTSLDVVLLGYYPVPDQSAPDQLKTEFESEATERLEGVADAFVSAGVNAIEAVVVFTRDRGTSVDRVAAEFECDAVLAPGQLERVNRVLVPLRGDPNLDRIVMFVAEILQDHDAEVTLFHAVEPDEDPTESEFILRGAADRLSEIGIDRDRIDWHQSETESPSSVIVELAEEYDIVVIGESEPTLRDRILGDIPNRIIDRTGRPVLIIRDIT